MNNYEEEYFEDENDLEEEHFGDFVDFWDDTPEFDEQIEEFKTALRADVKREIKELIEKLQKELDELKDYKACMNCAREDCNLSGFFELARKRLYIHAMLERKEEGFGLLNVFAEALPFLVIDCKERIAQNECTAK